MRRNERQKTAWLISELFNSRIGFVFVIAMMVLGWNANLAAAVTPSIAGGGWHTIALKNDGSVWSWGYNRFGQLGRAASESCSNYTCGTTPAQVTSLSGVIAIAGGGFHTTILKDDGTVWAWGYNRYGQLGDGTTTDSSTPMQVTGLSGVNDISSGYVHSVALKNDGTIWAWGYNRYGQLGNGTTTNSSTPVQVTGLSGVIAISGGGLFYNCIEK